MDCFTKCFVSRCPLGNELTESLIRAKTFERRLVDSLFFLANFRFLRSYLFGCRRCFNSCQIPIKVFTRPHRRSSDGVRAAILRALFDSLAVWLSPFSASLNKNVHFSYWWTGCITNMQRFAFDSSCPELDKLTGARVIRNIDRHHSRNFISSGHIQCCDEKKTFFFFSFSVKKESLLPPKVTSVMNGKAFISGEDSDAIGLLVLMMLTSESRTGPACQPGWWMALFFLFFSSVTPLRATSLVIVLQDFVKYIFTPDI